MVLHRLLYRLLQTRFALCSCFNRRVRGMVNVIAGVIVAGTLMFSSDVGGQTLFVQPDTTPNFASYQYLEACENAALRIADELETRKSPIWDDTLSWSMQIASLAKRAMTRRPDTAITVASVCLKTFNADTVHIKGIEYAADILKVLLIAHRDQDAERFAQRVLDTVRQQPEWDIRYARSMLVQMFGKAVPARMDAAKRYYAEQLAGVKDDSLYRTVYASNAMANIASGVGDTALFEETAWHAIRTFDSIPVDQRAEQFSRVYLDNQLSAKLLRLTRNEAFDSLAISTAAYKMYIANTVKARILGPAERKTPKTIDLSNVPDFVGEHYYVASNATTGATAGTSSGAARSELATYETRGAIPPHEIPVRGRVNVIMKLPSVCHVEGNTRGVDIALPRFHKCAPWYSMLRRLKQRIPELEITIRSWTYGTVGQLAPLTPAAEADTLAKLWLGWHHLPTRLVVEETQFYLLPAPDGRRIDAGTPYEEAFVKWMSKRGETVGYVFITDQDGIEVPHMVGGFDGEDNIRFLGMLVRRGRQ